MRSISPLLSSLLAFAVLGIFLGLAPTSAPMDPPEAAILKIEVAGDGGVAEGACFLVQTERRDHDVALYFLSAGHLFDAAALGESRTALLRIRVVLDPLHVIETNGTDVVFPIGVGQGLDLAIVRVVVPETDLMPVPIAIADPNVGDVFLIGGYFGGPTDALTARVRSRSARFVVADRAGPDVAVVGAPAIGQEGVFGVVTDSGPDGIPVVTLLSAARPFLMHGLPAWQPAPSVTPAFTVEERRFDGPLMKVACDGVASGDVEVPYSLRPREAAVDVAAAFSNPRALRLGDLTVASLDDRLVKLRFTLAGEGPSPVRPGCPPGQALVSVRMNVVVLPRP